MNHRALLNTLCVFAVLVLAAPLFSGNVTSEQNKNEPIVYNLYFGDLHTHTSYSDAWEGTPWDAYETAIAAGADFMAVTDHVPIFHAYQGLAMDAEEWADCLAAADYYTSENFVAMAGYEAWLLAHLGEINVYNIRELPAAEPMKIREDRLPYFYDWLAQQDGAIGQWNHPTYMTKDFADYAYLTESRDDAMSVIEAYNGMYYDASYVKALDAGWHVMPSANSDTHSPDWMSGSDVRTVLLAPSLTPDNLYEAMRENRGYATLDKNLEIYYTLNGEIMGSVLSSSESEFTATIHIEDPDASPSDAITLVEIVSDGGEVVASLSPDDSIIEWSVTLDSETSRYYFVRVTTASDLSGEEGITAWTAPVWTGR